MIPSYRALDYKTLPAGKWFAGGRVKADGIE
jgi:hypothetical protein